VGYTAMLQDAAHIPNSRFGLGDDASQYEKNRDTLDVWFDSWDGAFIGWHSSRRCIKSPRYL
jgi:isoleucyl-tRNA synthetase